MDANMLTRHKKCISGYLQLRIAIACTNCVAASVIANCLLLIVFRILYNIYNWNITKRYY